MQGLEIKTWDDWQRSFLSLYHLLSVYTLWLRLSLSLALSLSTLPHTHTHTHTLAHTHTHTHTHFPSLPHIHTCWTSAHTHFLSISQHGHIRALQIVIIVTLSSTSLSPSLSPTPHSLHGLCRDSPIYHNHNNIDAGGTGCVRDRLITGEEITV